MHHNITLERIGPELRFATSRSSGPGGQNVNKVNSKVTLKFDIVSSTILSDDEKSVLLDKLAPKLTVDGILVINAQESRSQIENKEKVKEKLLRMLSKAFETLKPRKPTKPSKSSIRKKMESKKQHSEKKKWRQGRL